MNEISVQDILCVLIQKEKTIAALSQQITTLMQENQALMKQVAEHTEKAA